MARPSKLHPDPLVRDLQNLHQLSWSTPDGFARLEELLESPLVRVAADGAEDLPARVAALEAVLTEAVGRLRRAGRDGPRTADAATRLLRLKRRYESPTIATIRERIASGWPRRGARDPNDVVTSEGFRKYVEVPRVFEPLARELREMEAAMPGSDAGTVDLDDVEERIADLLPAVEGLERVALRVWARERAVHCERLDAIVSEGFFRIRDEAEMYALLKLMTGAARHEMQAVDHIDLSEWNADPRLATYLEGQFERVRRDQVALTRIRLVDDEELNDPCACSLLARFVERHDSAHATLLLCRSNAVTRAKLSFAPRTGLFLIDPQTVPAAVVGWGGGGPRDETEIHLRETKYLCTVRGEFELLREHAVEHCDADLRRRLRLSPVAHQTPRTTLP